MNVSRIAIAGALALGLAVSAAHAQQQGGVVIGGDVNQNVRTGDVTTSAEGQGSRATSNIGSVSGNVAVGGDVTQKVKTGDVTTRASGKNSCAGTNIGSVTSESCK